ncbi:lysylphosphatidylglycerol synthetase-like protein (DUF2156 family) [Nocardioides luteus]|uniref:Uncharacterized protein n=1 Tax=Nocardioides luteus TaxID=1844 RepID=A0ABQ5SSI0_9ACTN|nr:hypothetical protein [Nocardioides luteus]MDR7309983.1 lysylphosphatidylglycerol synthetase-like protein (DUF2156 family) [Nocardioides luteus]GGR59180.1 hypothetical protein GCM10010197_27420 [Nocardioides luteus]GLJ67108.1 hypothetical protein GCM10017579_11440 [Nocardioides luteus]
MTMTTPDENEGVVVNEDPEVAVEVAALAAEPVPREMTWAIRLIIGLIAFSAVVVVVMVVRSDDLVRAWAEGNASAKRILETEGLDALINPPTDNRISAPAFIAPAITLFGVMAIMMGVLAVFLRNGFEWSRITITFLVFISAVASVGGILTGPPVLISVLTAIAIVIAAALLVVMWLPANTRYIHPPHRVRGVEIDD